MHQKARVKDGAPHYQLNHFIQTLKASIFRESSHLATSKVRYNLDYDRKVRQVNRFLRIRNHVYLNLEVSGTKEMMENVPFGPFEVL